MAQRAPHPSGSAQAGSLSTSQRPSSALQNASTSNIVTTIEQPFTNTHDTRGSVAFAAPRAHHVVLGAETGSTSVLPDGSGGVRGTVGGISGKAAGMSVPERASASRRLLNIDVRHPRMRSSSPVASRHGFESGPGTGLRRTGSGEELGRLGAGAAPGSGGAAAHEGQPMRRNAKPLSARYLAAGADISDAAIEAARAAIVRDAENSRQHVRARSGTGSSDGGGPELCLTGADGVEAAIAAALQSAAEQEQLVPDAIPTRLSRSASRGSLAGSTGAEVGARAHYQQHQQQPSRTSSGHSLTTEASAFSGGAGARGSGRVSALSLDRTSTGHSPAGTLSGASPSGFSPGGSLSFGVSPRGVGSAAVSPATGGPASSLTDDGWHASQRDADESETSDFEEEQSSLGGCGALGGMTSYAGGARGEGEEGGARTSPRHAGHRDGAGQGQTSPGASASMPRFGSLGEDVLDDLLSGITGALGLGVGGGGNWGGAGGRSPRGGQGAGAGSVSPGGGVSPWDTASESSLSRRGSDVARLSMSTPPMSGPLYGGGGGGGGLQGAGTGAEDGASGSAGMESPRDTRSVTSPSAAAGSSLPLELQHYASLIAMRRMRRAPIERVPLEPLGSKDPRRGAAHKAAACAHCATKFNSFLSRKHHCRGCGAVLCDSCTPYQAGDMKRICKRCNALRQGRVLRPAGAVQDVLHWLDAVATGDVIEVETRLSLGADVNAREAGDGLAALHIAAGYRAYAEHRSAVAGEMAARLAGTEGVQLRSAAALLPPGPLKRAAMGELPFLPSGGSFSTLRAPSAGELYTHHIILEAATSAATAALASLRDARRDSSSAEGAEGADAAAHVHHSSPSPIHGAPVHVGFVPVSAEGTSTGSGIGSGIEGVAMMPSPRLAASVRGHTTGHAGTAPAPPVLSPILASLGSLGSLVSAAAGKLSSLNLSASAAGIVATAANAMVAGAGSMDSGDYSVPSSVNGVPGGVHSGGNHHSLASSSSSGMHSHSLSTEGAGASPVHAGSTGTVSTAGHRWTYGSLGVGAEQAAEKTSLALVKLLIQAGADVNQATASGRTPLHMAVLHGSIPVIQVLLDEGALQSAVDKNGLTPHDYAALRAAHGCIEAPEMLGVLDARHATGTVAAHVALNLALASGVTAGAQRTNRARTASMGSTVSSPAICPPSGPSHHSPSSTSASSARHGHVTDGAHSASGLVRPPQHHLQAVYGHGSAGYDVTAGENNEDGDGDMSPTSAGVSAGEATEVLHAASTISRAVALPMPPHNQMLAAGVHNLDPAAAALQANLLAVRNGADRWLQEHAWLDGFLLPVSSSFGYAYPQQEPGVDQWQGATEGETERMDTPQLSMQAPSMPSAELRDIRLASLSRPCASTDFRPSVRSKAVSLGMLDSCSTRPVVSEAELAMVGNVWRAGHPVGAEADVTPAVESAFKRRQGMSYCVPTGIAAMLAGGAYSGQGEAGAEGGEEGGEDQSPAEASLGSLDHSSASISSSASADDHHYHQHQHQQEHGSWTEPQGVQGVHATEEEQEEDPSCVIRRTKFTMKPLPLAALPLPASDEPHGHGAQHDAHLVPDLQVHVTSDGHPVQLPQYSSVKQVEAVQGATAVSSATSSEQSENDAAVKPVVPATLTRSGSQPVLFADFASFVESAPAPACAEEDADEPARCRAVTFNNVRCSRAAQQGLNFCHAHSHELQSIIPSDSAPSPSSSAPAAGDASPRALCTAFTTRGMPCKRAAQAGLNFCHGHSSQLLLKCDVVIRVPGSWDEASVKAYMLESHSVHVSALLPLPACPNKGTAAEGEAEEPRVKVLGVILDRSQHDYNTVHGVCGVAGRLVASSAVAEGLYTLGQPSTKPIFDKVGPFAGITKAYCECGELNDKNGGCCEHGCSKAGDAACCCCVLPSGSPPTNPPCSSPSTGPAPLRLNLGALGLPPLGDTRGSRSSSLSDSNGLPGLAGLPPGLTGLSGVSLTLRLGNSEDMAHERARMLQREVEREHEEAFGVPMSALAEAVRNSSLQNTPQLAGMAGFSGSLPSLSGNTTPRLGMPAFALGGPGAPEGPLSMTTSPPEFLVRASAALRLSADAHGVAAPSATLSHGHGLGLSLHPSPEGGAVDQASPAGSVGSTDAFMLRSTSGERTLSGESTLPPGVVVPGATAFSVGLVPAGSPGSSLMSVGSVGGTVSAGGSGTGTAAGSAAPSPSRGPAKGILKRGSNLELSALVGITRGERSLSNVSGFSVHSTASTAGLTGGSRHGSFGGDGDASLNTSTASTVLSGLESSNNALHAVVQSAAAVPEPGSLPSPGTIAAAAASASGNSVSLDGGVPQVAPALLTWADRARSGSKSSLRRSVSFRDQGHVTGTPPGLPGKEGSGSGSVVSICIPNGAGLAVPAAVPETGETPLPTPKADDAVLALTSKLGTPGTASSVGIVGSGADASFTFSDFPDDMSLASSRSGSGSAEWTGSAEGVKAGDAGATTLGRLGRGPSNGSLSSQGSVGPSKPRKRASSPFAGGMAGARTARAEEDYDSDGDIPKPSRARTASGQGQGQGQGQGAPSLMRLRLPDPLPSARSPLGVPVSASPAGAPGAGSQPQQVGLDGRPPRLGGAATSPAPLSFRSGTTSGTSAPPALSFPTRVGVPAGGALAGGALSIAGGVRLERSDTGFSAGEDNNNNNTPHGSMGLTMSTPCGTVSGYGTAENTPTADSEPAPGFSPFTSNASAYSGPAPLGVQGGSHVGPGGLGGLGGLPGLGSAKSMSIAPLGLGLKRTASLHSGGSASSRSVGSAASSSGPPALSMGMSIGMSMGIGGGRGGSGGPGRIKGKRADNGDDDDDRDSTGTQSAGSGSEDDGTSGSLRSGARFFDDGSASASLGSSSDSDDGAAAAPKAKGGQGCASLVRHLSAAELSALAARSQSLGGRIQTAGVPPPLGGPVNLRPPHRSDSAGAVLGNGQAMPLAAGEKQEEAAAPAFKGLQPPPGIYGSRTL